MENCLGGQVVTGAADRRVTGGGCGYGEGDLGGGRQYHSGLWREIWIDVNRRGARGALEVRVDVDG